MRTSLRTRIVVAVVAIFAAATSLILGASYLLVRDHLQATLPASEARSVLDGLLAQYGLAVIGMSLLGAGVAMLVARRLLGRLDRVTAAAARASGDRLEERLALGGPQDEVRELGDTFDAMLDRLQESIETQRRFIANASHELRSPLTAIRTEVEVTLSDSGATEAELRDMGERVLESADDLDQLLAALMVLARSQRALVRAQPVDLRAVTEQAVRDALRHAGSGGEATDLQLQLASDALHVPGDPALLRRLAGNLIDNALRYRRGHAVVSVALDRDGDRAVLRVSNRGGVPVPPGEVERLRQPFARAARVHASGSGLGLSIVQAVAEAHGGTVAITSLPEGGLDVRVKLPLATGAEGAGAETPRVLTNT